MKVLSVNVSLPRTVRWKGRDVTTGIFKEPVSGPVLLRRLDLDGDQQADLSVHGGPDKAAYAYPSEHYPFWKKELPGMELLPGMFGENFTTEGLNEENTHIGDRFRIGEAVVTVTQPRTPCYKLGIKFGDDGMVKRFLVSMRSGFYLRVLEEGRVEAGDAIERVHLDENEVAVADLNRVYVSGSADASLLRRAASVEALSHGWKKYLLEELARLEGRASVETK
ncbi:MAG TPA: MOSC domain-containing protein [Candidatus Sulfotelmatobacter sp.]|nr:MOSC domain-containing protein [Candidatus Sulfotelmatobacter sp.]